MDKKLQLKCLNGFIDDGGPFSFHSEGKYEIEINGYEKTINVVFIHGYNMRTHKKYDYSSAQNLYDTLEQIIVDGGDDQDVLHTLIAHLCPDRVMHNL